MPTEERSSKDNIARVRGAAPDSGSPPREAGGASQRGSTDAEAPPRPRRNYALAIIMALVVFALLIGMRVLWGGFDSRSPTLPPEQPAPAATSPSN